MAKTKITKRRTRKDGNAKATATKKINVRKTNYIIVKKKRKKKK